MSSLFKQFKTDTKKEAEGVLVKYDANADGTIPGFRVARLGTNNLKYRKAMDRATRPHRRAIELNSISQEKIQELNRNVFVETILLGWENVQDAEGKTIEFTGENAKGLFKLLPDLYDDLASQAAQASLFASETVEGDTKN